MVSARFRRHSRRLRNHFATTCYLRRAAKLASTLRFSASSASHISGNFRRESTTLCKKAAKFSQQKADFATLCKILPLAWSDRLAMAVTPSFQLRIAHHLKHWIFDFLSFEMDLIDQGLVNLGQPSVTMNPLSTHSTYAVPPRSGSIHHIDFVDDDNIHMMSWNDGLLEPIVLDDGHEVNTMGSHTSTPFSLISDWIVTRSGRVAQPSSLVAKPFDGAVSHEEVRREDDELLSQLQSTQACISIWSLLASSSIHRDALIRALGQIRVETTTTPEGWLFKPHSSICLVGQWLALNIYPLAIAIALGYEPSDFGFEGFPRPLTCFKANHGFIRPGLFHLPFIKSHSEDDLFLTEFTFDEVQNLEVGNFCRDLIDYRDLIAMSFDQHSCTVVLDMMRERVRARLTCTPFDYHVRSYKMSLTGYFIAEIVQPDPTSPFNLFEMSGIEVIKEIQIVLAPELMEDVAVGFISCLDNVYDSASMDLSIFEYLSTFYDNPIDERVSPATGDIETIDFGTEDQPRELKIGHSMLSFMDGFSGYNKILMASKIWRRQPSLPTGRADHLTTLEIFFERIQKFRFEAKPQECIFGVTSGKLIGHMVSERGIEVDPDKIKAILDMPVPKTEERDQGFSGQVTLAFEKIKKYLLYPPILVPPMSGRPLLLYLSVLDMALG
ncbi:hypothetical protein CK203_065190 [Vitis vinifera]|uniref:Reverse transcriptase/retrotransposon-derived protein RNase H-like domain-containing protein n=1 Tax=Vitis vinifera TaxID=29760 RepID=A0A438G2L6_VITVI|nr:hypothetical protein CK203_065190 [Vitis vinifera]